MAILQISIDFIYLKLQVNRSQVKIGVFLQFNLKATFYMNNVNHMKINIFQVIISLDCADRVLQLEKKNSRSEA